MDNQLLIVGIDPGMTAAYAALNTKGELIRLKSAKHLNLPLMISELLEVGRVIAVGTDVKYSPKFVEKFCTKLGAKLISPTEDMKVGFKTRFTQHFKYQNDHQRDALASALYAYHELRPLLKKVELALKQEGKEHLIDEVTLSVIHGLSIHDAIMRLDEKKVMLPQKKRMREKTRKSTRILDLNNQLRKENEQLMRECHYLQTKIDRLLSQRDNLIQEKIRKTIGRKEKSYLEKIQLIQAQKKKIEELSAKVTGITNILFSLHDKVIAKHLKTLGWEEVKHTIKEHDAVILVDDSTIFSEKALAFLRGKVSTIITKSKPPASLLHQPFHLIQGHEVVLEEHENVAIVNKESLEKAHQKSSLLTKIIQEYKEERTAHL